METFPLINIPEKSNTHLDATIKGRGNFVSDSATNVIGYGDRNMVGAGCNNISILNSSGCVVLPGITGVALINSSGITVTSNDEVWVNNSKSDKKNITTTNNSVAVLVSVPVVFNAILIKAAVLGLRSDSSGGFVGEIIAGFRIEAGTLVHIGGSVSSSTYDASVILSGLDVNTDGGNAQIIITPESTTVNWSVNYSIIKI